VRLNRAMPETGIIENAIVEQVDYVRWYWVEQCGEWFPSVTSVLDRGFPKAPFLINWFKKNTPEFIEAKSSEGKEKGTEAHGLIERVIEEGVAGGIRTSILNSEEKDAIKGFITFTKETNIKYIAQEQAIFYNKNGIKVAGRFDAFAEVNGIDMVLDWKRSKSIYETYPPQVSLYADAMGCKTAAILLLNDSLNKKGYRFKTYDPAPHLIAFKAAYDMACYLGLLKKVPNYTPTNDGNLLKLSTKGALVKKPPTGAPK